MSVDKLVDSTQLDSDLTSVANAIRTKGGTSAALAFPADFLTAIAAIPSGGSSVQTATGTFTGNGTSADQIVSCNFEPDIVYARKQDNQGAVSYTSCFAMGIVRNMFAMGYRHNASSTSGTQAGSATTVSGLTASSSVYASYDSVNKQVTLHYAMNSSKWAALTYDYTFVKYT